MAAIDRFLSDLLKMEGSDLHIPSGSPPIARVRGVLTNLNYPPMAEHDVKAIATEILSEDDRRKFETDRNIDFAYEMRAPGGVRYRFRGNSYLQKNGQNIVLRAIPNKVPTLQSLGLPQGLEQLTHYHQGLVVATGSAGCGKTSTIAALIQLVNETRTHHIITVEDPIEYIFTNRKSLIHQRQVGLHVDSFQGALKDALREDPDVIYIGELRDLETTQNAITAAETGHLVLSTMHTNSAIRTIDRIIDAFPYDQQSHVRVMLSESLKGIITQQLIPRTDGQGRVVAYEVLIGTISIANMIRDGRTYQINSALQTGKQFGMRTMDDSLRELLDRGLISREEAIKRADESVNFQFEQ